MRILHETIVYENFGHFLSCNETVLTLWRAFENVGRWRIWKLYNEVMLLAIDIGNTQTSFGLFDGARLEHHWVCSSNVAATQDELYVALHAQLDMVKLDFSALDGIIIACVVPALKRPWAEVSRRITGKDCMWVSAQLNTGLAMKYDNPAEIGADRIADAVAAFERFGAPVLVVDLGTATNIEVINSAGEFLGGIIAPGLEMGASVLAAKTAQLPQVDFSKPKHIIGSNTIDAMHTGIIYGEVKRIDGLVELVFDELGYTAPVVATGGISFGIAQLSHCVTDCDPLLTLYGLRLLYDKNAGEG